jgi:hypothetical protein
MVAAGAIDAAGGDTPADRLGGVVRAAQGALTLAKPSAGFSLPVLAASAPGMVADYFRGQYDNVPRDEIARQSQPVPPGIQDIRGPATMDFAKRRALQFNQVPQALTQANSGSSAEAGATAAPQNTDAMSLLNNKLQIPVRARLQTPALLNAPQKRELGPLPQLQAGQNQSIFSALMNLGGDMNRYREVANANRAAQADFQNAMDAGKFNIEALSKMSQVQTQFDDNERKMLDAEIKARAAEAARILASGQFDKSQESGLRILAGMEKGKFTPAVVYGEADPITGQQLKITVAVRDDGTVVPLQVPGRPAAAKTVTKADFQAFVKKNGYSEQQARAFLEKQGYKVEG